MLNIIWVPWLPSFALLWNVQVNTTLNRVLGCVCGSNTRINILKNPKKQKSTVWGFLYQRAESYHQWGREGYWIEYRRLFWHIFFTNIDATWSRLVWIHYTLWIDCYCSVRSNPSWTFGFDILYTIYKHFRQTNKQLKLLNLCHFFWFVKWSKL
jgi:hypothetical protein